MAQILSDQYKSVFSIPATDEIVNNALKDDFHDGSNTEMNEIHISKESIKPYINHLKNEVAAGPNGISAMIYKNGGDFILDALDDIHNMSYNDEVPILASK